MYKYLVPEFSITERDGILLPGPSCHVVETIELGTIADNNRGMVEAGRQAKGMKNGRSKLIDEYIVLMRSDYQAEEKTIKELAEEYDIHYNTAKNVVQQKTWKD